MDVYLVFFLVIEWYFRRMSHLLYHFQCLMLTLVYKVKLFWLNFAQPSVSFKSPVVDVEFCIFLILLLQLCACLRLVHKFIMDASGLCVLALWVSKDIEIGPDIVVNDVEVSTHGEGRWYGGGEAVEGEVEDGEVDKVPDFNGYWSGERGV
ncbi:hypothetical protein L1887_33625 [Cichorium endivia]|nr:hypothetical protein L1887_33625 [Cichorium endivia]